MPSGWVRWILEQYEFDFEVVYPQTLDAGNLKAKYDVLLFPDGGIPEPRRRGQSEASSSLASRGPRTSRRSSATGSATSPPSRRCRS